MVEAVIIAVGLSVISVVFITYAYPRWKRVRKRRRVRQWVQDCGHTVIDDTTTIRCKCMHLGMILGLLRVAHRDIRIAQLTISGKPAEIGEYHTNSSKGGFDPLSVLLEGSPVHLSEDESGSSYLIVHAPIKPFKKPKQRFPSRSPECPDTPLRTTLFVTRDSFVLRSRPSVMGSGVATWSVEQYQQAIVLAEALLERRTGRDGEN